MRIRNTTLQMVSGTLLALAGAFCSQAGAMDNTMGSMSQDSAMGSTMVGGHAMSPSKNIVQNAVNSDAHTTLVAAVKQAGLVKALEGAGPYTVFAPTNDAFDALPEGTVSNLMKPENKDKLKSILLYHVVQGRLTYKDIIHKMMAANSGEITLKTLNGQDLTARLNGDRNIVIVDDKGDVAHISTYNVHQSNGVIHVIDHVLLP